MSGSSAKFNKLALKKVLNGTTAERTFLCENDFKLFFVYYFVDYVKFGFAPFHFDFFQDIKDLMDGKIKECAWIAFRESAKSSIAKAFVAWLIIYKKRKYLNVDSYDRENAERLLFDIVLELQTNSRIKKDFGELYNAPKKSDEVQQKRVNNFVANNGVRVEAHSTQESVRGRIHGHQRPDFLLLDDFESNKTKDSVAYTQQVIEHINEFKSGLDATAVVLYLGNYITEMGSVQMIMDRAKEYDRLRVRNIPVIEDGKPTWPDKYCMTDAEKKRKGNENKISLEDKKKELGSQVFNVEMMNLPIDEESQEFFQQWFRSTSMEEVDRLLTRKFVTIDTAVSQKEEADFTGITKNWVDERNNWYLISEQYKINPKTLIDLIFRFHEEGFEKIGIEETAYSMAIKPFFEDECRVRNKWPNVVELKHRGRKKEARIRALIPRYEAGTIFHIGSRCEALEEQLIRFPKTLHDDVADSAQYQFDIAESPHGFIEEREKYDINKYERINNELV